MRIHYLWATGMSALALEMPAMAQTAALADRQNAEAGSSAAGQDIIVTATRREETVLKAPLSITAYSQAALDLKGVRNIEDIARMTPGVSLNQGTFGIKYLVIRGLTSSVGATMNGVYIDDTPIQVRSISLENNFYPVLFDLERVEVLRGPQGTAFGSGSMGGAIRFISTQPSVDKYSGYARAELATTEHGAPSYEAGAAVGGPLVRNKIGFRVSAYYRRDGGYIDRVPYTPERGSSKNDANWRGSLSGQAALTFKPTEALTITPSVYYQRLTRHDGDQSWVSRPGAPTPLIPIPYPAFTIGDGGEPFGSDRAIIYSVKGLLDLGSVTLINNTAFTDRKVHTVDDGDGFFRDYYGEPQGGGLFTDLFGTDFRSTLGLRQKQQAFTQELRLQSNGTGRLSYELGVFYQNSRQRVVELDTSPNPLGIFPGFSNVNGNIAYAVDTSRDKQLAGFAQVDYRLFDKLKVTTGVRYSHITVDYSNGGGHNLPTDSFVSGSNIDKPWTPKFGLEYQATDKVMVYAQAAKGFRPGGPNPTQVVGSCTADLNAIGLSAIPTSYRSDSVWSYEVGAKGRPARFVEFAADLFQLDWSNVQRLRSLLTCTQNFIQNLGASRARGIEAKIVLYPARGLSIDTNLSYTDAVATSSIPNYVLNPATGVVSQDTKNLITRGDRFAPKWIISVAADYEASIRDGVIGYGHIQWDHRSGYNTPSENAGFIPLYGRVFTTNFVAARMGARFHKTDVSLFVNNLFNSTDELNRLVLGDYPANRMLVGNYRPRTIGATVSYRY